MTTMLPPLSKDAKYQKRWRIDRAHGVDRGFVSATAAGENVQRLQVLGCSITAIAYAAGVSTHAAWSASTGEYATMQRRTASALEALTLHDVLDRALDCHHLPRWAAQRRIHSLRAIGWSHSDINTHLRAGLRSQNVTGPNPAKAPYLRAHTWRDVDRVYRLLHMTPGPSSQALAWAKQQGVVPPLAWDDIDDPDEVPSVSGTASGVDHIAVRRVLEGDRPAQLTSCEVDEVIRVGAAEGLGFGRLAVLLEMSRDAVQKRASRAGVRSEWVA